MGNPVHPAHGIDQQAGAAWPSRTVPHHGRSDFGQPVEGVLRALRAIPMPLPRRDAVAVALRAAGFGDAIAQWMTTNVRPEGEGFVWRFDLDAMGVQRTDKVRVRNPLQRA